MGRWIGSVKVHGRRRERRGAARSRSRARTSTSPRPPGPAPTSTPTSSSARSPTRSTPRGPRGTRSRSRRRSPDPQPQRWHVAVRDGTPVTVERRAPANPPDAVVTMTRAAFSHLLRGEPPPSGERPAIRGDRAAVALLKGWTDRAQGRAAAPTLSRSLRGRRGPAPSDPASSLPSSREHARLRPSPRPLGVLAARRRLQDRQARRPRGRVRPAGARASPTTA